jgi:uncharacterized protein (DUF2384 family)
MAEPDFVPFAVWSAITLALAAVTGIVYRTYSRRKSHENPPS